MPDHDANHLAVQASTSQPSFPQSSLSTEQHQKQTKGLQQPLPNEIIYLIIDQWCSQDLSLLAKLLRVNKFFFYAALPHLWNDPFETWRMNDIHKDIKSDREKLMATMLASFMEARILEQQQQQQQQQEQKHLACGEDHEHNRLWRITDQEADAQRIDNVLKPFGLRIAEGVELRTPMLRPYLWKSGPNANWNSINEEEEEVEDEEEEEEEEEEGSSGENMTLQETNITRQRRMTVDYSKYFGSLVSYEWRFLKFERLIRLRRLPLSMRGDVFYDPLVTFQGALSLEPSEMDENEDDEEQSEIHSRNQTTDGEYKSSLMESLARLLLHYNFEIITHLAMDMSDAQKFLPYAPKLAKLKTIHLQRSISMPDSYLENTLQFIRQNRTAFPAKYPLDLELDYGWFSYDSESDGLLLVPMDSGEGSVEKLAVAFVNRQRDSLYQFMKPLFALLEATGPPKNLRVTQIPFFYGHSDGIRLDRLESFSDNDPFRLDYGEGPALRNFLKKCDHVRELDICVGNKDFFTWAADETLAVAGYPTSILSGLRSESVAGQDPPSVSSLSSSSSSSSSFASSRLPSLSSLQSRHGIFRNLQTLALYSDSPYRFLIHTLNDAMVAFADTLRVLQAHVIHDRYNWDGFRPESILARKSARMSIPLYRVPWANIISGGRDFLPFQLLHLRNLSIRFIRVASIQIGTLSQCPNLEEIDIQFGAIEPSEMHPEDQALLSSSSPPNSPPPTTTTTTTTPSSFPSSIPLGYGSGASSPRHQQARIDRSLFPRWDLPRLRKLELHDMAALRFDFESLRTMQNLESLEMSVSKKIVMWYMTSEFMARQESAWELKYNLPPSGTNVDVGNDDDDDVEGSSNRNHKSNSNNNNNNNNNTAFSGEDKNVNKGGELWDWSLPTLKSLTLNGPPATMFFLEWLRGCPNLEELSLMATGEYQHITRNPFFAPHWFSPREVFMTEIGVDDENRNESINNHKGASDDGPLLQSRLKKIVLSGSWVMSNDILISLLTVYAPLLERFHVDRLHERNSLNGTQFLRVMRQVDKINRTYAKRILSEQNDAEQQEQKMPGENLTLVSAKYTLSKRERPALKVVVIKQSDVACYHANNLRVYCLISQYLVRQEDYDLMEDIMFGRVVTDTPTS